MKTIADIKVTAHGICLNGKALPTVGEGRDLLTNAYRTAVNDYPKFFKMDGMSRLGFIATELLLQSVGEERFIDRDDRAVVLFSRQGSADTDRRYEDTIRDADNYFPSPAVFVYTLPNILTGEIAIRNHYLGETASYLLADRDEQMMADIIRATFSDAHTKSVLAGWVDYQDASAFDADIRIVTNE